MIYVTTDWHIGHKNIQEYCGRPDNWEKLLWKNFRQLGCDDILIALGDMVWGDNVEAHKKIQALPCRKWLIRGNHEDHDCVWYLKYWDFCANMFKFHYNGNNIIFSHEPMRVEPTQLNMHGHLHNLTVESFEHVYNKKCDWTLDEKHIRICIETLNYKPNTLDKALRLKRGPWFKNLRELDIQENGGIISHEVNK
jgi:calcineurin-like phosphoesterase family protein